MIARLSIALILLSLGFERSVNAQEREFIINGFTEAFADIVIGLPEAGRVFEVNVSEGQFVEQGAVLLSLDKAQEELALKRQEFLVNQKSELVFARKRVNILKEQYLSAKRLFKDSEAISQDEFESKQLEYLQAQSDVKTLEDTKKLEQIEFDLANERLARRVLKAPVSGVVANISKKIGESVQAHEELVRIVNTEKGRFIGNTETGLGRQLAVGQDVCLQMNAGTAPVQARIVFISPTIDVASGLMEVKAEFNNQDEGFNLGLSADLFTNLEACPHPQAL